MAPSISSLRLGNRWNRRGLRRHGVTPSQPGFDNLRYGLVRFALTRIRTFPVQPPTYHHQPTNNSLDTIMRALTISALALLLSTSAFAQQSTVKGNVELDAKQKNVAAIAIGAGNAAKNTAGSIKGNANVSGNTKIKASQSNTAAIAIGIRSTSKNEVGVIGGN